MNHEDEISRELKAQLLEKTRIKNFSDVIIYYFTKYSVFHPSRNRKWEIDDTCGFMVFLLRELGIKELVYKNEKLNVGLCEDNSLSSIFHNWIFRIEIEDGLELRDLLKKSKDIQKRLLKRAKTDTAKYKKHIEYDNFLTEIFLNHLNEYFDVMPVMNEEIEGFIVESCIPSEHSLSRRNQLVLNEKTMDILISERELEDYLVRNLHCVEAGLIYMGRQVKLKHGIIDILAKDKNETPVIIELKIEDDKDILWQEQYYTKEISAAYKKEPRFIVIAPTTSPCITQYLKTVELLTFDAVTAKGKIVEVKINSKNYCKGA